MQKPKMSRRAVVAGVGGSLAAAAIAASAAAIAKGSASPSPRPTPKRASLVAELLATPRFSVAHRGGSSDWPEMSLYAYEQSVAAGADALEFSLGRTEDGVWFGVHDPTLDRTSGTTGFVVAEHTWAEVSQHRIRPPAAHRDQPARPYLRLDDFVKRFGSRHSLWIDPKSVASSHHAELMELLDHLVPNPAEVFVAKSYCTLTSWGEAARKRGWQSWGFYYGKDLAQDPALFERTRSAWTLYGLDIQAGADQWKSMTAAGRPVVAHVLETRSERSLADSRGAAGAVIADIRAVLG